MSKSKIEILKQAQALFEKNGYHKTTLTDIAKSVGKVKTAIYYYFTGKEEIFEQLVRLETTQFLLKLKKEVLKKESPEEQLQYYINVRVSLIKKIVDRYQFFKEEIFELIPLLEKNRHEADLEEKAFVKDIMDRGNAQNVFKITNTKKSSEILVNTIKGLEIQMFITDQFIVNNSNIEDFRNLLLYGVLS